jgi:hypothetical protein
LSPRPRATFTKRQKEHARQEKQRAKAERKQQRKLGVQLGVEPENAEEMQPDEQSLISEPQQPLSDVDLRP